MLVIIMRYSEMDGKARGQPLLLNPTCRAPCFLGMGKNEHTEKWSLGVSESGERLHVLMEMV